jgi:hypothetical protein
MKSRGNGHNVKELAFRIGQYIWNIYDHLRLTTGYQSTFHYRSELSELGSFFIDKQGLGQIASLYKQQSEARQLLLQRADTVCRHRFDLLGYKKLSFDQTGQTNWHFDPVRDISLPRHWWQSMLNPVALNGADPKIVWELNRHQHLVLLAQAYVVSGEERYRAEVLCQLRSWMDTNPPKYGINWASSLELAYRSIAWLWTWFLCGSGDSFGELTDRFVTTIGMHAEHIEHNLSVYFSPNTHLSGEALGLYYIGTLLPGLKGAKRWQRTGSHWLMHCLDTHVLSDGGYMERTLWYHRYTTDIYLHFYLLGLRNGDSSVSSLKESLQKLGCFLIYSLQPDSMLPHLGDDDGGRLLPLDGRPGDDPCGIFSILAVVFRSNTFAFLADKFSEEALWLLGPTTFSSSQHIIPQQPPETSKVFAETGYAFLRSGWNDDAIYISFDCGRHGWLNSGHAHADMLSVQVYTGRTAIIKDPGTCSYLDPWRDQFRNAESHAILKVDGNYPSVTAGPFQWQTIPTFSALRHQLGDRIDYIAGTMNAGAWQHSREIFFFKPDLIVLLDTVMAEGRHEIEWRFPLADSGWRIDNDNCVRTRSDRVCSIQCKAKHPHQMELIEGWQSPCYGLREIAGILVLRVIAKTPYSVATLIDLTGIEHSIRFLQQNGRETFLIEKYPDGEAAFTVQSSLKEDSICAAFAE